MVTSEKEEREVVLAQEEREPRDEGDGDRLRNPLALLAAHTRSLVRSPMSPVGRTAMSTMTTPKAKTSL